VPGSLRRALALGAGLGAAGLALPLALELRLRRPERPLTDAWRRVPIARRGSTRLGISFRPPQVEALGLDVRDTLETLLAYPFPLLRLGAYWNRIEPRPDAFEPGALDAQLDLAEQAGKEVVLSVGALKTFSYPELYVPPHHLDAPLEEGTLITPASHSALLVAAMRFAARIVQRYRDRRSVVAWQLEHEAVDPLGAEHSWRLASAFVEEELDAVRTADPTRPVLLNGFLPTSAAVGVTQWWRTRDQGDSLSVAGRLGDIVGIDYYPRHALAGLGGRTLYLDGGRLPWVRRRRRRLVASARASGQEVIVAEGQAEPWETITTAPDPAGRAMYSCRPEDVIGNYNDCLDWGRDVLSAYLFWGAEYWVRRARSGDPSYLGAFARVLAES
jgi:hypothetical protein